MRSSTLLSPGQALSPYVSKRPRSRRFSRSPQQYGFPNAFAEKGSVGATAMRVTGSGDHGLVVEDYIGEEISPMQFTREGYDGGHDDEGPDHRWDEAGPGRGSHSVFESRE